MRPHHPGPGWTHVAGSVYGHQSGARLHTLGMVRLPNGEHVSASEYPEYCAAGLLIKMNGGNRKRGLMAWARNVVQRTR